MSFEIQAVLTSRSNLNIWQQVDNYSCTLYISVSLIKLNKTFSYMFIKLLEIKYATFNGKLICLRTYLKVIFE